MKILIAGASGMVGAPLTRRLRERGHDVTTLVRRRVSSEQEICWQPDQRQLDAAAVEGFNAFISLSGENIAEGRWTSEKKKRIVESRVVPTRLLADTIVKLKSPPRIWLSASATGYYGSRDEEGLTERSSAGAGFLAGTCVQWENATAPASGVIDRLVMLRISAVLDPSGGALAKLLPIFRSGLGGPVGGGNQYMSWISLDDLLAAIQWLLVKDDIRGAVNLCTPEPVRNSEFSKTLARVLKRPAVVPTPAFALKLMFGEMATETVLASARVFPEKLQQGSYSFIDEALEPALTRMLGKPKP